MLKDAAVSATAPSTRRTTTVAAASVRVEVRRTRHASDANETGRTAQPQGTAETAAPPVRRTRPICSSRPGRCASGMDDLDGPRRGIRTGLLEGQAARDLLRREELDRTQLGRCAGQ